MTQAISGTSSPCQSVGELNNVDREWAIGYGQEINTCDDRTETQSVLFDQVKAETLIEFGPSPTLLKMAMKTLEQFNAESDAANGIRRTLLSTSANYDEISHETGPLTESGEVEGQKPEGNVAPNRGPVNQAPASVPDVPVSPLDLVKASVTVKADIPIPDVPVSALESIKALVAGSLKKPSSEIKLDDSIRTLSGGRSTVQNEIIGDMLAEFGPLADDVENVPIKELASTIQKTYDGKLRKCLRTRIEKMIASKMPGSFGSTSLRTFLSDRWGLASGRQDAVLLVSLSQQPAARFKKTEDAEAFLDGIAQGYMDGAGLARPASNPTTVVNLQQTVLDSKVVQELRDDHNSLRRKIASLLLSEHDDTPVIPQDEMWTRIQADKLDIYEGELGDDFSSGIKPQFKAKQQRSYDSSWNWGHVDLLILYYKCLGTRDAQELSRQELLSVQTTFRNRWNGRMERVRQYLLGHLSARKDLAAELTRELLESLGASEAERDLNQTLVCDPCDRTSPSSPENGENPWSIIPGLGLTTSDDQVVSSPKPFEPHSLHILRRRGPSWVSHKSLTAHVTNQNRAAPSNTFTGKDVLITGAGPNSIGITLLPFLLQGGARVVVVTSRPMPDAGPIYQKIFASYGGKGSKLVVLPCNQGSKQDIGDLIAHVYDTVNGLGWDLDFILPFAALSEKGHEIDNLDSKSELAHRVMMTNVLRLMGAVKLAKEARGSRTRPAHVLLPLSPNMGTFGNDGLYSESKMGLMAVLNKWSSESWSDYLSLCGVIIGWTRGTGLMAANDAIAEEVAKLGVTTFSTEEMGRHILSILSDPVVSVCQTECLMVDLSGGMNSDPGLAAYLAKIRQSMRESEEIKRALADEEVLDMDAARGEPRSAVPSSNSPPPEPPLVDLELGFPVLPDYTTEIQPLHTKLDGMVDLESVVVVVGFAEIGPWGNSRTRWDMEVNGELSLQGCIELAWMTGLIKHNPTLAFSNDGVAAAGWIDVATGTPVGDIDVKAKYEKRILEHTGLRLIDPSPLDHISRDKKQVLQEIVVQHDMEPFAASYDTAMEFVREQGDKVQIEQIPKSDEYSVRLRKGAILMIPKATIYDRIVGGQLPTGWDPQVYGLPRDLCDSIDRCTLMALVCAAEAFLSAGITDVYELYKTMHLSELANCVGSGMGGSRSLQKLFRQRYLDRQVQNDILAETFINTTGAWLNMLLMSSAGPTRTPVGACATALESLNQGYDLIANGAAKVCLVGGFDDMIQDTSAEFANMRATNNSVQDMSQGRAPHETSRPTASSRSGFVESEGCGMQVLTSAKVALELGLPIRAVVAHVATASDGVGRSVPAPGKGIMANVRESSALGTSPLLNIDYRRQLLDHSLTSIRERKNLHPSKTDSGRTLDDEFEAAAQREEREARRRFGNTFWTHDPRISPLRGALAVWNLTADDIGVVSLHGTSTELNEKNEAEVLHRQLSQLGRSTGNAALAVCQKYLTGHPKGAAAAWMLNGCCQIVDAGIVPGNRNADNIDAALEPWEHLVFPDRAIQVHEVKAFSVTSFGFGQKGAQALGVHPRFLFATLGQQEYDQYCADRQKRYAKAKQHFQNAFYGGKMVTLKDEPPYPKNQQLEALVDASARFG